MRWVLSWKIKVAKPSGVANREVSKYVFSRKDAENAKVYVGWFPENLVRFVFLGVLAPLREKQSVGIYLPGYPDSDNANLRKNIDFFAFHNVVLPI